MAEVLGVTAASLQLADVATKLVSRANRLRSRLRHLPQELESAQRSLDQLAYVIASVRSAIERDPDVLATFTPTSISQLTMLFADCEREINALEGLINKIKPDGNDTKLKGAAKVLRGVVKDEEIRFHQGRFENLQDSLNLWCTQQNLLQSWRHGTQIAALGEQVNSTEASLQTRLADIATSFESRSEQHAGQLSAFQSSSALGFARIDESFEGMRRIQAREMTSLRNTQQVEVGHLRSIQHRMSHDFPSIVSNVESMRVAEATNHAVVRHVESSIVEVQRDLHNLSPEKLADAVTGRLMAKPGLLV